MPSSTFSGEFQGDAILRTHSGEVVVERAEREASAPLAARLTLTEERLRACESLCRRLRGDGERRGLATVRGDGVVGDPGRRALNGSSGQSTPSPHDLAAELRHLAESLEREARALVDPERGYDHSDASDAPDRLQLRAIEAERARLARELHDGPAQYFANAVFQTEYLERLLAHDPTAVASGLTLLREGLRHGVAEIRRCIFDLRLPAIDELGLVAWMTGYLADYERQFAVTVEASLPGEEPRLNGDQTVTVFRVLQEALTNAVQHGQPTHVGVDLEYCGNAVRVRVRDDGCGFDPGALDAAAGHYGVISMKERAAQVRGSVTIASTPGEGTQVEAVVPSV